jgi:hypothetical protein
MAKYIFQLRRGWKYDEDPETGLARDDWATYEAKEDHIKPLEGELVLEYDNGIPRLKIGNGVDEFSALPYMSVDSFILPKPALVHLSTDWKPDADDRYYQVVTVQNAVITSNSKVDLLPDARQLSIFHEKDLAFVAENEDGVVKVYCVGQVPQNPYDINVTVTEVVSNG